MYLMRFYSKAVLESDLALGFSFRGDWGKVSKGNYMPEFRFYKWYLLNIGLVLDKDWE